MFMENLVVEHPFYRFHFDESSSLRAVDISSSDYDSAVSILYSIIPRNYKFVRCHYFPNIY